MAENLREWFDSDETPTDFYQLLGKPRLHPSREELQDAIRSAYRTLHTLENHAEAARLPRARALQRMVVEAEQVVGDDQRWRDYDEALVADLRARYAAGAGGEASTWRRDNLGRWLARIQNVHPERIPGLVETFLATGGTADVTLPQSLEDRRENVNAPVTQPGSRPPVRLTSTADGLGQAAATVGQRRPVAQPLHGPGGAPDSRREAGGGPAARSGAGVRVAPGLRREAAGAAVSSGAAGSPGLGRPVPRTASRAGREGHGEASAGMADRVGTVVDPGAAARALSNLLWMAAAAVLSAVLSGLIGVAIVLTRR